MLSWYEPPIYIGDYLSALAGGAGFYLIAQTIRTIIILLKGN